MGSCFSEVSVSETRWRDGLWWTSGSYRHILLICVLLDNLSSSGLSFFLFLNLFLGLAVCLAGLVPQPGVELAHPAVKVRNPHHWIPRDCPVQGFP